MQQWERATLDAAALQPEFAPLLDSSKAVVLSSLLHNRDGRRASNQRPLGLEPTTAGLRPRAGWSLPALARAEVARSGPSALTGLARAELARSGPTLAGALTALNLRGCGLGPRAALALGQIASAGCPLAKLDVRDNAISDQGLISLAEGVDERCRLRELKLQRSLPLPLSPEA
eukprot:995729-Prymnesium_polylepis.1